ncbi:MAG: DUF92 domain-containing protein [Gemmatimonadaceae bacterium]
MLHRSVAGVVLATAIAWMAWRAGSLSRRGAAAAVVVGTCSVAAGWAWAALLMVFFLSSTLLTRWRARAKTQRAGGIVEKGGARDAVQVLSNGGVFAFAAVVGSLIPSTAVQCLSVGALATAASDTWGTEVGIAVSGRPRFILTGRIVAAGTSGAVSIPGTVASIAGACFMGGAARWLGFPPAVAAAAAAGGLIGALVDSLLGATVQERRHCPRCDEPTERLHHACGAPTILVGGVPGVRNDLVNLTSGALGGVAAVALGHVFA